MGLRPRRQEWLPAALPGNRGQLRRKSLILTTNLEFSKWGGIFTDDQMAAAMIDRLVHHGRLVLFEGQSNRMTHALMRQKA